MKGTELTLVRGRPEWASCAVISRNLLAAYHEAYSQRLDEFHVRSEESRETLKGRGKAISTGSLVILDHAPSPVRLLSALTSKKIEISLHVYGEVIAQSRDWLKCERALLGKKIRFLCPSSRAAELFGSLLNNPEESVRVLPYPIANENFYFDPAERALVRRRMKFREADRVFIYAGRLSLQKNVDLLLKEFARMPPTLGSGGRPQLLLVGSYDDVGSEMLGLPSLLGYSYRKIQRTLRELSPEIRSRVHFLGSKTQSELRGLLNAADVAWSLSLFHEEDFGMAIAEALACGLRAVVTDWGGHVDFARTRTQVKLASVALGQAGPMIDTGSFERASRAFVEADVDNEHRLRRALRLGAMSSIQSTAKRILELRREPVVPFTGFSAKFRGLATAASNHLWPQNGADSSYQEFYGMYYGPRAWRKR